MLNYSYSEIFQILIQRWKTIGISTLVGFFIAVAIALVLPKRWETESRFLINGKSASPMGGLASLASVAGLNLNQSISQDLYVTDLIFSYDFLEPLIEKRWASRTGDSIFLSDFFEIDTLDLLDQEFAAGTNGLKKRLVFENLKERIEVSRDRKSTVIKLLITLEDPLLVVDFHKGLLEQLQIYNDSGDNNKAANDRKFIEEQLQIYSDQLAQNEDKFKTFKEKNKDRSSPGLELESNRLQLEIMTLSSIVIEFRKQLELAKLEEARVKNYLEMIVTPNEPLKPSFPKKSRIALLGLFLGFFMSLSFIILQIPNKTDANSK